MGMFLFIAFLEEREFVEVLKGFQNGVVSAIPFLHATNADKHHSLDCIFCCYFSFCYLLVVFSSFQYIFLNIFGSFFLYFSFFNIYF